VRRLGRLVTRIRSPPGFRLPDHFRRFLLGDPQVRLSFILLIISLLAGPVSPKPDQGGGKAEPKRIEFARGRNSTAIKDSLRRTEEAEYVFSARQEQHITIRLTSAASKSLFFRLRDGDHVYSSWGVDGTNWSGTAPATAD
jgi:hypothetical protein